MKRVMLVEPKCCATFEEDIKCGTCGLDGSTLAMLRKYLPATESFLYHEFPEWTGKGAIYQGEGIK